MSGLDETDRQIVEALIRNARISYSDLGELVGLSRVAVKSRIDALEKRGIIEEYTTIINPQKLSGAVSCYFEIETEPSSLKTVTDILEKNEMVTPDLSGVREEQAACSCGGGFPGRAGKLPGTDDAPSSRRAGYEL